MIPSVMIRPLKLCFAAFVNLYGAGSTNMFNKNFKIRLPPIKSPILRKYTNPFTRGGGSGGKDCCILVFLSAVL